MFKRIKAQFWVGTFDSEARFQSFVKENLAYHEQTNPACRDEANEATPPPLSRFAASQGQSSYDHDFLEAVFADEGTTANEMFAGASWVDRWGAAFDRRVRKKGPLSPNALIMMVVDKPPRGRAYRQIQKPTSHQEAGVDLVYLGELSFPG